MMRLLSRHRLVVLLVVLTLPVASRGQTGAASVEIDYAVPSGYVSRQQNGLVVLAPQTDGVAQCIYIFKPPRPSNGPLQADAEAELVAETIGSGMRRTNDYVIARQGVAPAGWRYFLVGGNFEGQTVAGTGYFAVMVLMIPTSPRRVSVVVGVGGAARCNFDDVSFAQLFLSLSPRDQSNPSGNALQADLIGSWQGSALSGHTFYADGGYSKSAAGVLNSELISSQSRGRYAVRGSEITITSGISRQAPERFHVYVYDKWNNSGWQRAMTVLYHAPPSVAEYVRGAQ